MTTSYKKFDDRTGIVLAILEDRTQYRTRIFEFLTSITAVVLASVKPLATRTALIAEFETKRAFGDATSQYLQFYVVHVLLFTRQKRMGEQAYIY